MFRPFSLKSERQIIVVITMILPQGVIIRLSLHEYGRVSDSRLYSCQIEISPTAQLTSCQRCVDKPSFQSNRSSPNNDINFEEMTINDCLLPAVLGAQRCIVMCQSVYLHAYFHMSACVCASNCTITITPN